MDKGALNTCAKFQGLPLKNGVDFFTFVLLSAKSRLGIVIAWFEWLPGIRFWALNLT